MEEVNFVRRELTQEEQEKVLEKSAVYVNAALTTFNSILSKAKEENADVYLESTSVMQSLATIALSIITSIGGNKERSCVLLTDHIDHLDSCLMKMEEMPSEDSYKASEEISPQAITETNDEWLARQKGNEHDVTCSE